MRPITISMMKHDGKWVWLLTVDEEEVADGTAPTYVACLFAALNDLLGMQIPN